MMEDVRETRFDNGVVVLTDRMPDVRSVTLGFFFRVGARHEPRELHGMTHFIEHAVFKGTRRRSALEIAVEQDRLGGNLDAFTTHEDTGFAIKVIDDQFAAAFDLMADMLTEPVFNGKDLEAEQRVIIEEMKMIDDSPEEFLGEIFSAGYFPGHPLGLSIPGTPESVKTFDHETTRAYHKQAFSPKNLVIAAAGNVEHDYVVRLAEKVFSTPAAPDQGERHGGGVPSTAAPILIERKADLEQAHLVIATPFVSAADERRYAGDLLANIIGGGTSSRLWQKIREERGLAYSVGTSTAMYQDCGVFSVYAGTSPEQVGEVVDLTIHELCHVVQNGVTTEELKLAKQQTRASILLSLEDSAVRAASIAECEMTHSRQISVEESLENTENVTIDDCRQLAYEFFRTENIAFGALGDFEDLFMQRERLAII